MEHKPLEVGEVTDGETVHLGLHIAFDSTLLAAAYWPFEEAQYLLFGGGVYGDCWTQLDDDSEEARLDLEYCMVGKEAELGFAHVAA